MECTSTGSVKNEGSATVRGLQPQSEDCIIPSKVIFFGIRSMGMLKKLKKNWENRKDMAKIQVHYLTKSAVNL